MPCNCCSHDLTAPRFDPFIDIHALLPQCPLDNGRKSFELAMCGPESSSWKMCRLQSLPIELYHSCLQFLDIGSVTTMRRVSQYTRSSIDSLHQYKELYQHAPEALRACLKTGIAPHIPLIRLHSALTSMECYYCRMSQSQIFNFSSYLSLHTGHRACLFCIRNEPLLRSIEFQALITLCTHPRSSISITSPPPLLRTLPGTYNTPLNPTSPSPSASTLVLCSAIELKPNRSFSDQERKFIFGNQDIATIYHHPLVKAIDESNINPTIDYIGPDTSKQITHKYTSVIPFPYVPPSKSTREHGVFCTECVLSMRYREHKWMRKQRERRIMGLNNTASTRTVDCINQLRRMACRQYVACEGAPKEGTALDEKRRGMSITEHRKEHIGMELSNNEKIWRELQKGPPLPLLGHDRFG